MEHYYCIECKDIFLSDDYTEILCPDCCGDKDYSYEYTASKRASKSKRLHNRKCSTEILTKNNISFEIKNDGAHLIVSHNSHIVDFWPGTGKFIFRQGNKNGRGVLNLLKMIGIDKIMEIV